MNNQPYSHRPFNVLLVEDNEDDVILTRHAFEKISIPIELQHACDGVEALEILRHDNSYADSPRPDIILLDLNMPRMDGRQLLAEMKQDERLKQIPIVILTTSESENDVCHAYRKYASAYMAKPIELNQFQENIQRFAEFWLSRVVILPPPPGSLRSANQLS
jgi:CheY-like chemotaxis protein